MNTRISQLQFISIGACYLMGTIVVSSFIATVMGTEAWMAGITGALCFVPAMLCYLHLAKRHPGLGLFEINEAVFGPVAGRILSGVYLVFFFSLCALNVLEASNFLRYFIMSDTPLIAVAAVFVVGCVYGVRKGIMPIARVATVFGIVSCGGLLLNIVLSLNHANFEFLLPMFSHKLLDYVQGSHIAAAIPFGESLVLMMLIPKLSQKASLKKCYVGVLLFTAVIIMAVHFREAITLGPLMSYTALPSFESVRMINIANTLTRTESLFALLLISMNFFKTLILLYVSATGLNQIFRLESYRHTIIMMAALLTVYAVEAYGAPSNNIFWGKNVSPFIWSLFTLGLPLLTLFFSLLRGGLGRLTRQVDGP